MTTDRHPATTALLRHFEYGHLPPHLQIVSKLVHDLAHDAVAIIGDDPELSMGLRKLLEAKDCLVRARNVTGEQPQQPTVTGENVDDDGDGGFHRGASLAASERAWTPTVRRPDTRVFGFGR